MSEAQVWTLVGELRSHMLRHVPSPQKLKKKNMITKVYGEWR